MDAFLGVLLILFLVFGIGGRKWWLTVREAVADRREDRRLRRKYDF